MSEPMFEKAEAAQVQEAASNINLLVDALEKIEAKGCVFMGSAYFQCLEAGVAEPCPKCIAHQALETFRGR